MELVWCVCFLVLVRADGEVLEVGACVVPSARAGNRAVSATAVAETVRVVAVAVEQVGQARAGTRGRVVPRRATGALSFSSALAVS